MRKDIMWNWPQYVLLWHGKLKMPRRMRQSQLSFWPICFYVDRIKEEIEFVNSDVYCLYKKYPRIGLMRGRVKLSHLIKFKRSRSILYCIAYIFQCVQESLKFVLCELSWLTINSISIKALIQPVTAFTEVFLRYVAE